MHRRAERLGQRDRARHRAGGGHRVADDDRHLADRRAGEEVGQLLEAAGHAVGRAPSTAAAASPASWSSWSIGQRHEHGPGRRVGGVVERAAQHRAQLARRAHLVAPLHGAAGQLDERPGQQRVGDDVAVVLLAGGHHQRRAVRPGVGEVADGVAEAGRGVEVEERRSPGGLGVAVGHADDGGLLEREHVAEVVGLGQGVDERQLGAARVAEDVPHALGAEHLEEHVASEAHGRAPYRWPVDWAGPPTATRMARGPAIDTALGLAGRTPAHPRHRVLRRGRVRARRRRPRPGRARRRRRAAGAPGRPSAALRRLSFNLSGAQLGITVTSLVIGFIAEPTIAAALEPLVERVVGEDRASGTVDRRRPRARHRRRRWWWASWCRSRSPSPGPGPPPTRWRRRWS